ncbi:MAG: hypothetical protein LAP13_22810 [Acidobacteriia bacterium]|nr:hypothetical protein [Terriglobia bacterium]
MAAVEATVANGGRAEVALVAEFLETSAPRANAALDLAVELGLLAPDGTTYRAASPLCRFTSLADQKAAVLRIVLEGYQPFVVFRERLVATADVSLAARHTKTLCALAADRDEIKDTLISLGTYSHAFVTEGGGNYQLETGSLENMLRALALACTETLAAEARVRAQLGPAGEAAVSRDYVILPLADALMRAKNHDASGAVQAAGNAVESHIDSLAGQMGVVLGTATGIISKLSKFAAAPRRLPAKIIHVGSYLGAIRNAADHGPDPDIANGSWRVREATALEYVYVACSFIAATIGLQRGDPPEI